MTRKDFELLAHAIQFGYEVDDMDMLARYLANSLHTAYPTFDRERFLTACRQDNNTV